MGRHGVHSNNKLLRHGWKRDGNRGSRKCQLCPQCHYEYGGPVRVGIFATSSSSREQAGATYWGITEMSGNLMEAPVMTVGRSDSRGFTGTHGDGELDASGDKTNSDWAGYCWRNESFNNYGTQHRVSNRYYASYYSTARSYLVGCRAVRSAP